MDELAIRVLCLANAFVCIYGWKMWTDNPPKLPRLVVNIARILCFTGALSYIGLMVLLK